MASLPLGTVTFLFTDIAGSTQLWENHPQTMRLALARHDTLLREAVEQNNGFIVKTTGDGVLAAFPTAPDALNASLASQQAFRTETWPAPVTIRVRMGIHTGAAEYRDGDYYGQTLNRAARLMAAGHGGQVLLSIVTQELCRDSLPLGTTLLYLGEYRLKDLNRPESLFQVQHPSLSSTFPKLKTLDNPELPNNLPVQLTSFIGRERDIAEVVGHLSKTRLMTITGSGGCGKTRLSLQVAADVLEEYPDGVWFVELAALTDPTLIAQTVAQALGVKEKAAEMLLLEHLRSKHLLLVIDNCEHLLSACAALVTNLLRSCPHIRILATSRERLNVAGEFTYRVPSLTSPTHNQVVTPASLNQFESVQLFIERALFHKSDFAVSNANAPALAQLCIHLDGIPLAIELAAARIRSLSVESINARLDNRFRLLTGGSNSSLPRQQTLQALIDWSYELLNDAEKVLLARLSVFSGGWSLDSAEPVCSGEGIEDWEILDLVASLADKSLVQVESSGETRYRMLETIRQYGAERLKDRGETEALSIRHRDWFLALVEQNAPKLFGSEQRSALDLLEREHDNLRAAISWCAKEAGGAEIGLRLTSGLSRFWYLRVYFSEGKDHLAKAIERSESRSSAMAGALLGIGRLSYCHGDFLSARSYLTRSRDLYEELGDKRGTALAVMNFGVGVTHQGENLAAKPYFEVSLSLYREINDRWGIATSLNNLGNLALNQQELTGARSWIEEGLAISRELGDPVGIATGLGNLAVVARDSGDISEARSRLEESIGYFREAGVNRDLARMISELGRTIAFQGDFVTAERFCQEGLALALDRGDKMVIVFARVYLAEIARLQGDFRTAHSRLVESLLDMRGIEGMEQPAIVLQETGSFLLSQGAAETAVFIWGSQAALREAMGFPVRLSERAAYAAQLAKARAMLGEDAYSAAWEKGRSCPWQQAADRVLQQLKNLTTTPD